VRLIVKVRSGGNNNFRDGVRRRKDLLTYRWGRGKRNEVMISCWGTKKLGEKRRKRLGKGIATVKKTDK